jgi:hypothetical protein
VEFVLWCIQVTDHYESHDDEEEGQARVHLIPLAFPAIHELSLESAKLGDGALFDILASQVSCVLRTLKLINCHINASAAGHAAHSLARLPHLRDLAVAGFGVPISIAAQLTGLTSLSLNYADAERMFKVAGQNTGLVELEAGWSPVVLPLPASSLLTLLSNCTSLTQLNIAGLRLMVRHWTCCSRMAHASQISR